MTNQNGLEFKLSKSERKLIAVFTPAADKLENLTIDVIKKRLEEAELAHLFVNESTVADFITRYNDAKAEAFECEIGERRDATCSVIVSDDKLRARLTLTPNFGGKEATLSTIQKALKEKEITYGIVDTEKLQDIIDKGFCTDYLVAEGVRAIDGIDSQFKSTMPEMQERKPKIDENGVADYRELGEIPVVRKDSVVMQRIPAIQGKEGHSVFGEVIQPKIGENIPFSKDMTGVYVNPEDENQLLSSVTGQPVPVPNGMTVSSILTLDTVDFSTGNVNFDGSVIIKGDVVEGMSVEALEDVIINGNVIGANIKSMGGLLIKGGVMGSSQLFSNADIIIKNGVQGAEQPSDENHVNDTQKIVARGSVIVEFVENYHIEAGYDIAISKYALNTELMAGNKIFAGAKNSSNKSSIIGGSSCALIQLKAAVVGARSGIKTQLQVGLNPYLQKRLVDMKEDLMAKQDELVYIGTLLAFYDDHPEKTTDRMIAKLHRTLSKITIDIKKLKVEIAELTENLAVSENARIIVDRGVFVGTEVQIGNVRWKAEENRGKSLFLLLLGTREISVS
jgi:uncharacterized protein (DUF342 family)